MILVVKATNYYTRCMQASPRQIAGLSDLLMIPIILRTAGTTTNENNTQLTTLALIYGDSDLTSPYLDYLS